MKTQRLPTAGRPVETELLGHCDMKVGLARALRARGRSAFIPYLTAGDPSLAATEQFFRALARAGADVIELGVPFSDPVADGPVIQAAAERALAAKTTLAGVLALAARLRRAGETTPIVLFTYLNPVLAFGVEKFAARCARAGVNGALLVDLPAEESDAVSRALAKHRVELVLLASPTTDGPRLRLIGRRSGSIVYYVSREGVTGARSDLASGVADKIRAVRRAAGKPVIVGFGVSRPEQARALARHADGVVVGSALVAEIARSKSLGEAEFRVERLAKKIVAGLGGPGVTPVRAPDGAIAPAGWPATGPRSTFRSKRPKRRHRSC